MHDSPDAVLANTEFRGNTAVTVVFVLFLDSSNLLGQLLVMSGADAPLVLVAPVKAEENTELGFKADIRLCNQPYFFEREASAVSLPSKP